MHRRKLLFTAVICLLLTAAVLASGTMAWLSKSQTTETAYTTLSDFEVSGALSFQDGTTYSGDSILASISFLADAGNYIGNMKYVVTYTGASPAYIRVRILEQWTDVSTNEILPAGFLNYKVVNDGAPTAPDPINPSIPAAGSGTQNDALAEKGTWVDNRKSDYCYYFSVPVQPKMLANTDTAGAVTVGDGKVELTLIDQNGDGKLVEGIDASTQMGLLIEVEAVQPNRYREFWGISSLPF